jgi:hypothetical protein
MISINAQRALAKSIIKDQRIRVTLEEAKETASNALIIEKLDRKHDLRMEPKREAHHINKRQN